MSRESVSPENISNQQNFNISSAINKHLVKVSNLLHKEYNRLDADKIDINCPRLLLIVGPDFVNKEQKALSEVLNEKMKELVLSDNKIIDFGLYPFLKDGKLTRCYNL